MTSILLAVWLLPAAILFGLTLRQEASSYRFATNPWRLVRRDIVDALLWPRILLMPLVILYRRAQND